MTAKEQVKRLLKDIYDEGDVNAMQVWKGYDARTGETGWHYKWFGRSEAHYMGKSVKEVKRYVAEEANLREAYISPLDAD